MRVRKVEARKRRDFLDQSRIVAIDFDGTIKFGNDFRDMTTPLMPGCKKALQWLKDHGFTIILWTTRDDELMVTAKEYLEEHDILQYFDYFNEDAETLDFKAGRKLFANYYIDDLNIGGFPGWDEVVRLIAEDLELEE